MDQRVYALRGRSAMSYRCHQQVLTENPFALRRSRIIELFVIHRHCLDFCLVSRHANGKHGVCQGICHRPASCWPGRPSKHQRCRPRRCRPSSWLRILRSSHQVLLVAQSTTTAVGDSAATISRGSVHGREGAGRSSRMPIRHPQVRPSTEV